MKRSFHALRFFGEANFPFSSVKGTGKGYTYRERSTTHASGMTRNQFKRSRSRSSSSSSYNLYHHRNESDIVATMMMSTYPPSSPSRVSSSRSSGGGGSERNSDFAPGVPVDFIGGTYKGHTGVVDYCCNVKVAVKIFSEDPLINGTIKKVMPKSLAVARGGGGGVRSRATTTTTTPVASSALSSTAFPATRRTRNTSSPTAHTAQNQVSVSPSSNNEAAALFSAGVNVRIKSGKYENLNAQVLDRLPQKIKIKITSRDSEYYQTVTRLFPRQLELVNSGTSHSSASRTSRSDYSTGSVPSPARGGVTSVRAPSTPPPRSPPRQNQNMQQAIRSVYDGSWYGEPFAFSVWNEPSTFGSNLPTARVPLPT